jgi:hypothetical protein
MEPDLSAILSTVEDSCPVTFSFLRLNTLVISFSFLYFGHLSEHNLNISQTRIGA